MDWQKLIEVLWAWPTVAFVVLALYRREIRLLLQRVATTSKARFGSLEIEMSDGQVGSPKTKLERVEGKSFTTGIVDLDGKEFVKCRFEDVVLRFSASQTIALHGCQFSGVNWEVAGAAALTLKFLGGIYSGAGPGGKELIEKTFENIRSGLS